MFLLIEKPVMTVAYAISQRVEVFTLGEAVERVQTCDSTEDNPRYISGPALILRERNLDADTVDDTVYCVNDITAWIKIAAFVNNGNAQAMV